MKVSARIILYVIGFLSSLVIYGSGYYDRELVLPLSLFTIALSVYNMLVMYNGRLSLSTVLLIYTILTQFGLIIPYMLVGKSVVNQYQDWTLAFLYSHNLGKAMVIGNIAIYSFDLARVWIVYQNREKPKVLNNTRGDIYNPAMKTFSMVTLLFVFFFFIFHILSGGMRLFGTYEQFMSSSAYSSSIYPYMLILFYVATLFLSASGTVKENLSGWLIWFFIAMIFSINGNKGEFLYSLLAVFGLKGVQGQKISWKLALGASLLLFLFIPSITALRDAGVSNNIQDASFSAFGAFTEMGMQLRTSVYTLDHLDNGFFNYLYGQSYWQPIVNIITPFMKHEIATAHVRLEFPGFGFNQVAESYLNFGVFGVMLFFSVIGSLICKYENKYYRDTINLALLAAITTVLINASRNYFVFVPGQILMVYVIWRFVKWTGRKIYRK